METGDCFLPCLSVRQSPFSRKDVRRTMNHKKMPQTSRPRPEAGRRAFRGKAGLAALLAVLMLPTAAWAEQPLSEPAAPVSLVQTAPDATPESALPESLSLIHI